ncbi:MAG: LacI family transcriptional regulator [Lentisphaerae bacterium]|nr:MAG: LacI family transcriptional regulator [Lentisphaerota bacterium]
MVWINAPVPGDVVMPDDVDAGYRLTMQLIRCGYRRILFLDHLYHMQPRHHSRELRLQGYRQAMMEAGLRPMFFTLTPEQLDLDRCACENVWLEKHPEGLDAIISYDYGQLTLLWHNGGFAGTIRDFAWGTFADHPQPALPGYIMVIPWETIGREAASMLLHRLEEKREAPIPSSHQQRKIPCRLYHRARQLPS